MNVLLIGIGIILCTTTDQKFPFFKWKVGKEPLDFVPILLVSSQLGSRQRTWLMQSLVMMPIFLTLQMHTKGVVVIHSWPGPVQPRIKFLFKLGVLNLALSWFKSGFEGYVCDPLKRERQQMWKRFVNSKPCYKGWSHYYYNIIIIIIV